jgi:RNA polymerase sigma factor (sigma-70 family)
VDDAKLLQASASGDPEAFAAFYRRHLPLVLTFCLRQTGSREAAADLTGEVFASALASCSRYEPRYHSAAPWLLGIARNKLLDSHRRGRIENAARRRLGVARLELDDDDLARVDELAALSERPAVSLVEALPSDERAAVRARIVDEREYADIAAELECSESVVRKRVSRGLARVRQQLSTEGKR